MHYIVTGEKSFMTELGMRAITCSSSQACNYFTVCFTSHDPVQQRSNKPEPEIYSSTFKGETLATNSALNTE